MRPRNPEGELLDGHVLNSQSHNHHTKPLAKPVSFAMKEESVVAHCVHSAAPVIVPPADRIVVHRRLHMLRNDDAAASAKNR